MAYRAARWWRWLKWPVALALLGLVAWHLDTQALAQRLAQMVQSPGALWVILASLAAGLVQVAVSAWRWRYTLGRLGVPMAWRSAMAEYYLATFLNQVLPGGVMGDAHRAWRSVLSTGQRVSAAHAVVIERFSGQLALAAVVAPAMVWLWLGRGEPRLEGGTASSQGFGPGALSVVLLLALGLFWLLGRSGFCQGWLSRFRGDVVQALWRWPAIALQGISSLAVVASYLSVFVMLAWQAGFVADFGAGVLWAALGSLLLLSMVLPVTVAGWGVREGAAAVLWPWAGLPAEQGVAVSLSYGVMVLLASLPGLLMWRRQPPRASTPIPTLENPGQTAYRCRD